MMTDMNPTIDSDKRFSVIWIIPIVALLTGITMVIQTKLSEGPTITISFDSATGLEAGKTKVEVLNVTMGLVTDIALNPGLDGVLVTVEIEPEAEEMLREDTRFWVIRARVGADSISGLGTLLSGAYIEFSPGEGKEGRRDFVGLEVPPLTPVGASGVRLTLYTDQAGSVSTGDAILYKGYKAGRIEGMKFDSKYTQVRYDVFIDAPYDKLVTNTVRFWNTSGIDVKVSAEGLHVRTGSLDTILRGGVAFGVPEVINEGLPVENGAEFKLYENYTDMQKQPYHHQMHYVLPFKQSIRGLLPGAPVEYRGIQIGSVIRIMSRELMASPNREKGAAIPVLIAVEPGRLELPDTQESVDLARSNIAEGVAVGLRGSLEKSNLLTGALYVNFDYYADVENAEMKEWEGYASIPTIATGVGRIEQQVAVFLARLNALPLEDTVHSADDALESLARTLDSLDKILKLKGTLELTTELSGTLAELRKVLPEVSPEGSTSFTSSLNELNQMLYNLEQLTRTLADKPNALVLPTDFPADPQPRLTPNETTNHTCHWPVERLRWHAT